MRLPMILAALLTSVAAAQPSLSSSALYFMKLGATGMVEDAKIYTIDTTTGVATLVSVLPLPGGLQQISDGFTALAPAPGGLFGLTDIVTSGFIHDPLLREVSIPLGVETSSVDGNIDQIAGLAYGGAVLYGAGWRVGWPGLHFGEVNPATGDFVSSLAEPIPGCGIGEVELVGLAYAESDHLGGPAVYGIGGELDPVFCATVDDPSIWRYDIAADRWDQVGFVALPCGFRRHLGLAYDDDADVLYTVAGWNVGCAPGSLGSALHEIDPASGVVGLLGYMVLSVVRVEPSPYGLGLGRVDGGLAWLPALKPFECLTLCGDCDQSGSVDILDAALAAHYAAGSPAFPLPPPNDLACCDVDGDLVIGMLDVLRIARYSIQLPIILACP